jgi:hypothetical protein
MQSTHQLQLLLCSYSCRTGQKHCDITRSLSLLPFVYLFILIPNTRACVNYLNIKYEITKHIYIKQLNFYHWSINKILQIFWTIPTLVFNVICLLKLCIHAQIFGLLITNTLAIIPPSHIFFFHLFCFSVEVWFFVSTYYVLPSKNLAVLTISSNMTISSFVRKVISSAFFSHLHAA